MSSFFDGMLYGLVFLMALGPSFFALFQAALKHGYFRAMCISIGVITGDGMVVFLMLFGFKNYLQNEEFQLWLGLVGAGVLISFGLYSIFAKTKAPGSKEIETESYFSFWMKGFALSAFNPIMVLAWVGIVSGVASIGYSINEQYWFYGGMFVTVFVLDNLKALLTTRLSRVIDDRFLAASHKVIGVLFVGFGISLVYYVLS